MVQCTKADGSLGEGPFTMETREMLRRLLQLQRDTGLNLITIEELKQIDLMWDSEGIYRVDVLLRFTTILLERDYLGINLKRPFFRKKLLTK